MLVNTEETAQTFRLDVEERNWENLFTGETLRAERSKLSIKLPAYGYAVLKALL
ncbi:hypothetical protein D3C81_2280070 [compost metagenome]